jgi:hypothetical protein
MAQKAVFEKLDSETRWIGSGRDTSGALGHLASGPAARRREWQSQALEAKMAALGDGDKRSMVARRVCLVGITMRGDQGRKTDTKHRRKRKESRRMCWLSWHYAGRWALELQEIDHCFLFP